MLRTSSRRRSLDLVAGIVLAAILVPQGLAYTELAGLPPVTGLYTTIACLVVYALLGPSRVLILGPDSSVSPLIFAAITPLLVANDTASAIAMAGMLALMVGLIEIGLGLGKLGFIADLLSKEVQVGYMNGLAITIIVGQLPKLFGFSTEGDTFVDDVVAFFSSLDKTNTTTLLVGLGTLALLIGLPRVSKKIPAVLVAVVAATVVSAVFSLASDGVKTVGTLPSGLPTPSIPWTSATDLATLAAAAVGIVLVSLTDTIATSSSFAARRGDEVDADREMIAVGASNVGAGLLPGLRHLGQRLAHGRRRAGRRQDAGDRPRRRRPRGRHARVHPGAAQGPAPVGTGRRGHHGGDLAGGHRRPAPLRARPQDGPVPVARRNGEQSLFFGVLQGILIAAILSILLFFRRSWWPPGAVLGYVPELKSWHDVERYPMAEQEPDMVVFRWEAPLFFANAGIFRQRVRKLVVERQPLWIVLQCEAITDIDVTAADMLQQLDVELNAKGIHFAFVELRERLQDRLRLYGLWSTLDREHVFAKMKPAIRALTSHGPYEQDGPYGPAGLRHLEPPDEPED